MKNIAKRAVLLISGVGLIFFILMATDFFEFGPKEVKGQLPQSFYPPNQDFKAAVEQVLDESLPDRIFDIVWKKTFHYQTFFESKDGFVTSAGVTLDDSQATLTTDGTNGGFERIVKQPSNQGLITFSQPSRMRTNFQVAQLTNQTAYLTVSNVVGGSQGYGFKIVNGDLYGVTHNGTSESTVKLQSLSVNEKYNIEARYEPSGKVIFFADDPTTSPVTLIREVGVLTTTLPSPAAVGNTLLFQFRITANAAAIKTMRVSFFEYFQRRDVLK